MYTRVASCLFLSSWLLWIHDTMYKWASLLPLTISDVSCSTLLSGAVINTVSKSNLGKERICLAYMSWSPSITQVSQGKTQKEQAQERSPRLAAHLPFSYLPIHLPSSGTAHSEPGSPTSINNQENGMQTCLQANLVEVLPQLRFPLPKRL